MTVEEIISLVWTIFRTSLPYLNLGMIALIISLLLRKGGFEISSNEFKKEPLKSLILGLALVLISGLLSLAVQTYFLGTQPFLVFLGLLFGYLVLSQV